MLPALVGQKLQKPIRDHLVLQSNSVRALALRQGEWKFIPGGPSGPQLYNLSTDLAETTNLAAGRPDKVKELAALLDDVRWRGRSRS